MSFQKLVRGNLIVLQYCIQDEKGRFTLHLYLLYQTQRHLICQIHRAILNGNYPISGHRIKSVGAIIPCNVFSELKINVSNMSFQKLVRGNLIVLQYCIQDEKGRFTLHLYLLYQTQRHLICQIQGQLMNAPNYQETRFLSTFFNTCHLCCNCCQLGVCPP